MLGTVVNSASCTNSTFVNLSEPVGDGPTLANEKCRHVLVGLYRVGVTENIFSGRSFN